MSILLLIVCTRIGDHVAMPARRGNLRFNGPGPVRTAAVMRKKHYTKLNIAARAVGMRQCRIKSQVLSIPQPHRRTALDGAVDFCDVSKSKIGMETITAGDVMRERIHTIFSRAVCLATARG
ncbi:MAG: hypothetical protein AB7K04_15695, partial [Pseudorhodoplanes sp.]